jgi:hypothetical protein
MMISSSSSLPSPYPSDTNLPVELEQAASQVVRSQGSSI